MARGGNIESALHGLENMAKGLRELARKHYDVQVGIFGEKNSRQLMGALSKKGGHKKLKGSTSSLTNAELGLVHEKGSITRKIPARSFLVMPLKLKEEDLKKKSAGDLKTLFKTGKIRMFLKRIGLEAENIIQSAFESNGFGKWFPNTDATALRKNSERILIDTSQLRRSIASRVVE